ncbi:MAG: hypothetical protein Q8S73_43690, partial [Deltaproteobacteria bacterium]|nr:hypothetical protein [Deltaproteobacteria bacterium]
CTAGACRPPACAITAGAPCTPGAVACCEGGRLCAARGGVTRCCGLTASQCSADEGCCGARRCESGRCCNVEGEPCSSGADCCGALVCQGGQCRAAPCTLGEAVVCTPGAPAPECCAGARGCVDVVGTFRCCAGAGGACTGSLGCCGVLICRSGVCG